MPEEKKTIIDKIWGLLASIKFAIVIFSLIALTSIIGTILEQRAEPARNILILSRLFGESVAPTVYRIFEKLGFMDMYHSWWFITILILFSMNIIICSFDRLPRIWKIVREPVQPLPSERFETIMMKKELLLKGKPDKVKDFVTSAIKGIRFNYAESKEEKGYQFYSQKGNYTRLGVYMTHMSIILILIGALIGISLGFKGSLNLAEGRSSVAFRYSAPSIPLEEHERARIINALQESWGNISKASELLGIKEKSLKKKLRGDGIHPLGFTIGCDDFDVDFYENSDMPRRFISWLTIIEDGKEVIKKAIEVNEPLKHRGITFYQSNYGMIPNVRGWFYLRVISNSGVSEIKRLNFGDSFTIPGTNIEGTIRDFSPALSLDQEGRPFTYAEMMNNPAVFIDFTEKEKKKYSGWIYKRHPTTWRLPEGHTVEFMDLWGVQYTGLQVRKDPGVWVVYLGCTTIAIGLFLAFFMSHRKLWVRIVEEKNNSRVIIGATANKNRAAFERKIDKMISYLSKKQEGVK